MLSFWRSALTTLWQPNGLHQISLSASDSSFPTSRRRRPKASNSFRGPWWWSSAIKSKSFCAAFSLPPNIPNLMPRSRSVIACNCRIKAFYQGLKLSGTRAVNAFKVGHGLVPVFRDLIGFWGKDVERFCLPIQEPPIAKANLPALSSLHQTTRSVWTKIDTSPECRPWCERPWS